MKKISLLILMLTFLLIPTCVNANDISYEDFESKVNEATGLNITTVLNNANQYNNFISDFNSCVYFAVFSDFGFASTSPDTATNEYIYFICNKGSHPLNFALNSGPWEYSLNTNNYSNIYTVDINTSSVSRQTFTNRTLFKYNINDQNNWSETKFISKTGMEFFLDTAYIMSWNTPINCQYKPNGNPQESTTTELIQLSSLDASDFPWEGGNAGGSGSGDTYYNYDLGEYFQKPWISIDNVQGLVQSKATIPFKVMSQSGDEYFPFDKLKLDLRVYKVFTDENGKKTQSLFDTYKRYNGDYVDTSGYSSVSQNGKINVYSYDLRSKFDSNFIDTYLNTSGDNFDYAFQLILYSFWEDELSSTMLFYFNQNNSLNSGTIPDNYYDNNWNGNSDFDFDNLSFGNILDTAKNFLSSIFSFFEVFPDWLIYLLTFGIAVAIALRILGR